LRLALLIIEAKLAKTEVAMKLEAPILESFKSLSGKTALITGASAGFGRATAILLASAGVKVLAVARRLEKLKELQALNPLIHPLVVDVSHDLAPISDVIKLQPVDILINNAGLARGRENFSETKPEVWNELFDINVKGLIAVTSLVLPGMLERNRGDIVNLGSIAGLHTYAGGSIYCATKFAVHALSEAWRQDVLGKDIRVIEICPGMAETEFSIVRFKGDLQKAKATYEGMIPLTAEDVAQEIFWALSRPRHITLQNVVIMPTDQAAVGLVHRRKST